MKKNVGKESEFIQNIETDKFISHLDQYMKTSAGSGQKTEPTTRQVRQEYEAAYKAVIRMSTVTLSKSDKSLNRMVNFRFRLNGQSKGIPETDEKTYLYFRKIRKHQMELLAAISDEVAIITAMVEESEKMRKILRYHRGMLEKATYLMNVLGERIEKRPTPLLSVEGSDDKVRELNETFQDMNRYEKGYEQEFRAEAEHHHPEKPFKLYHELIQDSHQEIEARKQNIVSETKELNEGWKILNSLITKGYSRRMRRKLDKMADKHDQRVSEFQEYVRKCRSDHSFPDEKPIYKNEQHDDSDSVTAQSIGTRPKKKRKKKRKKVR